MNKIITLIALLFTINTSYANEKILYLHIGLPKTGTSALQVFFAQNREKLMKMGLNYPAWDDKAASEGKISSGNGSALIQFLQFPGHEDLNNKDEQRIEVKLIQELKKNKNILFSSEFFTGATVYNLSNVDISLNLKKLTLICDKYGYKIKVICNYRSVTEFLYSYYSQRVKRHVLTDSFLEFLQNRYSYEYALLTIENWAQAVGENNIIFVDYDQNKHNLPKAIFSKMNIDVSSIVNNYDVKRSINRSLSPKEMLICREFNKYFSNEEQSVYISDTIIYNLAKSNEIKSIIKQSDIDFIVKKYSVPVAQFNKKYGTDIKLFQENTVISDENVDNELSHEIKALVCIMADQVKRINKLEKKS